MKYSFVIEENNKNQLKSFIEKVKFRNKIAYLIISITFGISSLSDLAMQFFFKDVIGLGPAVLSQMISIISIPWFLKPFFGLITDLVPICGTRRKIYIIICGLLDFLSYLFISLFIKNELVPFIILLFIHNACLSFQTVLGEAIVVELSKLEEDEDNINIENNSENNQTSNAKNYVSYFFFCRYIGSLISSLFKGILIKKFTLNNVFLFCSFIPFMFIISGLILLEIDIKKERNLIKESSVLSTANESCAKKFFGFVFQRHILVPIIFTIIFVGVPSYSDPLFYFFTEKLKFDPVDLSIVSIFTTIASLTAITAYRCYFKKKTFRSMILYGSVASFFISFSSYLLVIRYNIALGIPDFIFIIFSSSLNVLLGELIAMPLLSLAAVLSPKNLEATSYSVFMSAINFGSILSNLIGSVLTTSLNIKKDNFDNLPELILISNFLGLLPIPFICCLKRTYFDPELHDSGIKLNDGTGGALEEETKKSIDNKIDLS